MQEINGVSYLTKQIWTDATWLRFLSLNELGFFLMLIAGVLVLTFVLAYGTFVVWAERKVAGHVQDRLGPMRVGWHGWLQTLADGIKLMMKEDIYPTLADKPLFVLAPPIVFLSAFVGYAVVPFSQNAQMADLDIGVLYIMATASLGVIGLIMAGWASNSKWPLYGAMRSAALTVAYGIPLGLSIIPVLMVAGSLSMQDLVQSQNGGILHWNFFRCWPFMPLAFIIFFISNLAETNRVPFDIAEAESELVGGYHTEYSGVSFSVFFLAEYAAMYLACAVTTTLFLGGYLPPDLSGIPLILSLALLGIFLFWRFKTFHDRSQVSEAIFCAILVAAITLLWGVWPYFFWFLAKTGVLLYLMLHLRWTLPRLRIDQMMYMCWKVLTPVAFINILGTGLWWMWITGIPKNWWPY